MSRKKRVSEPAPNDIICFFVMVDIDRNRCTRLSIAVVRTYVPLSFLSIMRIGSSRYYRHTSVDDWELFLLSSRQKQSCKRIIKVTDFNSTQPRNTGILIRELDNLVFSEPFAFHSQERRIP